ncbi:MAG: hypothetical protein HFJ26_02055 [Clostridia bacterium]|jgi:hypothetical protein|nr:hypothetical protein [Clostridia bacterium]
MEKLKEKITVPNLIIIFIILQPIIDIITGLHLEYAKTSITLGVVIRAIFIACCVGLRYKESSEKIQTGHV